MRLVFIFFVVVSCEKSQVQQAQGTSENPIMTSEVRARKDQLTKELIQRQNGELYTCKDHTVALRNDYRAMLETYQAEPDDEPLDSDWSVDTSAKKIKVDAYKEWVSDWVADASLTEESVTAINSCLMRSKPETDSFFLADNHPAVKEIKERIQNLEKKRMQQCKAPITLILSTIRDLETKYLEKPASEPNSTEWKQADAANDTRKKYLEWVEKTQTQYKQVNARLVRLHACLSYKITLDDQGALTTDKEKDRVPTKIVLECSGC